jgi:hypothetical protein
MTQTETKIATQLDRIDGRVDRIKRDLEFVNLFVFISLVLNTYLGFILWYVCNKLGI